MDPRGKPAGDGQKVRQHCLTRASALLITFIQQFRLEETAHMDVNDKIHAQLVKAGVRLAAVCWTIGSTPSFAAFPRTTRSITCRYVVKPRPLRSAPARSSAAYARWRYSATPAC